MSNIGSVASSYVPASSTVKPAQTNFVSNVAAYGPVAASAIGVAEVAPSGASAVFNFSAESLAKLGDAVEAGYDAIGDAFDDAGSLVGDALDGVESAVSDAVNQVEDGVTNLYTEIADMAESGLDAIGDAASAVADGFNSAVTSVTTFAAYGVAAGKQVLSEVV